jgi:selenocysteine lyase/cysteine desulfurase
MPDGKEARYESSSSNIVAIAGLNAALRGLDVPFNYEHEKKLTEYMVKELSEIKKIKMYVPKESDKHVGIVSFTVDGCNSEDIGTILDQDFDIALRTGYHCAPYIHKYLKDEGTLGTIRVGLGQFSTVSDIDKLVEGLKEIIDE